MWDDYLWKEQPVVSDASLLVSPEKVKDVTAFAQHGVLNWEVPAGDWDNPADGYASDGCDKLAGGSRSNRAGDR